MKRVLFISVLAILGMIAGGCGTTFKVCELDAETNLFPTEKTLLPEEIKVREEFDLNDFSSTLLVRYDIDHISYKDFFRDAIVKLDLFEKVVTKEEFEQILIDANLADKISNISDMIGLHHAAAEYGDFLVADFRLDWMGGYNFTSELKVVNPDDGKTLLQIKREAFNWDGLDQPLFYPMLNEFAVWVRENKQAVSLVNEAVY